MHIRPYFTSDSEAVLELLRLNTPAYFAPGEEGDLVRYLEQEAQHYYVAEKDSGIVACGYNLLPGGTARISWNIVHPDEQWKGVGSLLTQFRIDERHGKANRTFVCEGRCYG